MTVDRPGVARSPWGCLVLVVAARLRKPEEAAGAPESAGSPRRRSSTSTSGRPTCRRTSLDGFTKATGIAVHYDLYDSNEPVLEKLQSGVADYDLVVPSDYMVRILIHLNLISRS